MKHGYGVHIGSDGEALSLLQQEFPEVPFTMLPSYNITYPKKGKWFRMKLFLRLPHIKSTMRAEKKIVGRLISEGNIQGIISDNRMGVRSKDVPSVFMTHQLTVLSGNTTYFSTRAHQKIIKKFDQCWVPDVEDRPNLSGALGHPKNVDSHVRYIGPQSRFKKRKEEILYDFLVLLSGPEPQRSLFEEIVLREFANCEKQVLLIKGVVEKQISFEVSRNLTIQNYMTSEALELAMNQSKAIISRPGYTTIMDVATLEKPAFFIPTPGQYEQEYLAKELKNKGMVPSCKQDEFSFAKIEEIPNYSGLKSVESSIDFKELFALFQGK